MTELKTEKYPRTYHFPFSEGATNDDRIQAHWQGILQHELVVTEKLDGENSCLKKSGIYARSHGAVNRNPWAKPVWDIWERVGHTLGDLHVFGENMYAVHSLEYRELEHYFYIFGIRDGENWLAWEEVVEYTQLLDLPTVPVIQRSYFDEKSLKTVIEQQQRNGSRLGGASEGVVCRVAAAFPETAFGESVLKYVRKNHVQTDEHWTRNWKKATLRSEKFDYRG